MQARFLMFALIAGSTGGCVAPMASTQNAPGPADLAGGSATVAAQLQMIGTPTDARTISLLVVERADSTVAPLEIFRLHPGIHHSTPLTVVRVGDNWFRMGGFAGPEVLQLTTHLPAATSWPQQERMVSLIARLLSSDTSGSVRVELPPSVPEPPAEAQRCSTASAESAGANLGARHGTLTFWQARVCERISGRMMARILVLAFALDGRVAAWWQRIL